MSDYELIEHHPGGTLAYPEYQEIVVARAAYEQLIEENEHLRELLHKVGQKLDWMRYGRADVYTLLNDRELQPYLWPGNNWQSVMDANRAGGVDAVIAALGGSDA